MTTALAVIAEQVAPLPALPAVDIDRAASYAKQDKAPATRAALAAALPRCRPQLRRWQPISRARLSGA